MFRKVIHFLIGIAVFLSPTVICEGQVVKVNPVSLILDMDMGNDIDDALALVMCHGLADRGECEILGILISKDNRHAAEYVSLLNTHYGRPNIPMGMISNGPTPDEGRYVKQVAEMKVSSGKFLYPRTISSHSLLPQAVSLLRKILARRPDRSVTIVMTGFSTNMARFLQSQADDYSPLDGKELMAAKVNCCWMMAGDFSQSALADPKNRKSEYNIQKDIPSAQFFVQNCPVPIMFSGFEIGKQILYPADSIEKDFEKTAHHPLVDAYHLYKKMPYDRPCWDLTVLLATVRTNQQYFDCSTPGTVTVHDDGTVSFAESSNGLHKYLILSGDRIESIRLLFVELVTQAGLTVNLK